MQVKPPVMPEKDMATLARNVQYFSDQAAKYAGLAANVGQQIAKLANGLLCAECRKYPAELGDCLCFGCRAFDDANKENAADATAEAASGNNGEK